MDEIDLVYKGPWVRSAQQRLFQTLETDYAFPRATCRSLVNLMLDFVNETFGEKLHEGQIVFHAASASEPPGKRISDIKSVPVHLTFHDRNDMKILTEEGTSGLRKHKIIKRLCIPSVFSASSVMWVYISPGLSSLTVCPPSVARLRSCLLPGER